MTTPLKTQCEDSEPKETDSSKEASDSLLNSIQGRIVRSSGSGNTHNIRI